MRNLDPKIKRQEIIRTQLWNALQGDMIGQIRSFVDGPAIEFNQRTDVAANAIKVTSDVMPELLALLDTVKFNLEFKEDVELYIQCDSEINAYSYTTEDKDKPHVIIITSAMVNIFDEKELEYIIGHELGHIINLDRDLDQLYKFIYATDEADWEEDVPLCIAKRYNEYEQLAEFAADRYGYLGCMDLNACVSAFYKMNAGLDLKKKNVNFDALMDQNFENLCFLMDYGTVCHGTHPMHPYRIQALVEFANCEKQKKMEENMEKLFKSVPGVYHPDIDSDFAMFLAATGLKIAMADGKIDKAERNIIIEEMACYVLEATKLFKQVQKMDLDEVINETLPKIKEQVPEKLEGTLSYLIAISFADKMITQSEIDAILDFGKMFDMDETEVYQAMVDEIKDNYNSLADEL